MIEKRIINVVVGDLKLPVSVAKGNEEEEEVIRIASKLINRRMQAYQEVFSDKEKFNILAMATLDICKELILEKNKKDLALDNKTLDRISKRLDEALGE